MRDLTEDEWADIVTIAFATGSEDYVGRPNRVYIGSFIQTYSKAVEGPIFNSYDVKKVLFGRNILVLRHPAASNHGYIRHKTFEANKKLVPLELIESVVRGTWDVITADTITKHLILGEHAVEYLRPKEDYVEFFEGIKDSDHYKNFKVPKKMRYRNFKKIAHGPWSLCFGDGFRSTGNFVNGELDGEWKEYKDGVLKSVRYYKKGKRVTTEEDDEKN